MLMVVPCLQLWDQHGTLLQAWLSSQYDHHCKQKCIGCLPLCSSTHNHVSIIIIIGSLTGSFDGALGSDPNFVKALNMATSP